jgi:predicted SnoaL-like aldol condensation-catalyzing enzyme
MEERMTENEKANLEFITAYFNELVTKKSPDGVAAFLSDDMVSHNANIPGKTGLINFAAYQAKETPAANFVNELLAIASGDLVVKYYTYSNDPSHGAEHSIVDIFRIKDGLITEFWTTVQSIGDAPDARPNDPTSAVRSPVT